MKIKVIFKGGKGSGNFNHAGRPGKIGGSSNTSHVNTDIDQTDAGAIDVNIRQEVKYFQSIGLHTFASCEGHIESDAKVVDSYISSYITKDEYQQIKSKFEQYGFAIKHDEDSIQYGKYTSMQKDYTRYSLKAILKDDNETPTMMTMRVISKNKAKWDDVRKDGWKEWMHIMEPKQ